MKLKSYILAAAATVLATPAFASTTIADWTFETSVPISAGSFAAEIGSGLASGSHVNSSVVYSSPAGNGSSHSFSSNYWSVGDYYQFQVSTTGLGNIAISWDQISSNTGPKDFLLEYSTNGTTFTSFGSTYSVLANASPNTWSSGTPSSASSFAQDLSSVRSLNGVATVYFRLVDADTTSANGGTVATGGTDRVDNVVITGTAIPEPSTYAILIGAVALGFAAWKRRR